MKTATRKIISLAFILLGFTPLLFVLVITLKKHDVRKRMREELQYRELQTIILPENEVIWMDKHEIWVNESMFDILTKQLVNGIYTFTGLYDEDETLLVKKERDAGGKNTEQNKILVQFFKSLPLTWNMQDDRFVWFDPHTVHNSYLTEQTVNPYHEIFTPPPQDGC